LGDEEGVVGVYYVIVVVLGGFHFGDGWYA
jgi:hypothetical protein